MSSHCCFVVPPYLLAAIAKCDDPEARESAQATLAHVRKLHASRAEHLAHLAGVASASRSGGGSRGIIPGYVTSDVATSDKADDEAKASASRTLALTQQVFAARSSGGAEHGVAGTIQRSVYDMKGKPSDPETAEGLPGTLLRKEGQGSVDDKAANEAYDNAGKVWEFYQKLFSYELFDGKGMPVVSSVHYSKNFGNAFWTSEYQQMVYGDGDKFIHNFTSTIDVIAHEMTHAVTEHNSNLIYENESGALNEHISDAFGIMVKQFVEQEKAESADWLIGEGCLLPGVRGVALRSMKAPGTAYKDQIFGTDLQPDNYNQMAAVKTKNPELIEGDQGGVHIFSGIPNKAFYLCALAFGGWTWEKAGKIWWTTVSTHRIPPRCTFIQFADATVDAAQELFGNDAAKIVRAAWNEVGVVRKD